MTTSLKSKKPAYKTEAVKLDNGSVVRIGRCSLENMETLFELQDSLLKRYIDKEGAIGLLLTDPQFVNDLSVICSLLPIIGKEDTYLDYDDISENWEQLVRLFFNGGINEDTRDFDRMLPSVISSLHFLPYVESLRKHITEKQSKEKDS